MSTASHRPNERERQRDRAGHPLSWRQEHTRRELHGSVPRWRGLSGSAKEVRILVAHGSGSFRRMVGQGLRELGFQVDEVEDGNDLLDRLGDALLDVEGAHLPDMVVADLSLSGTKGYDALIAARSAGLTLPFVLVTQLEAAPFREDFKRLTPAVLMELPMDWDDFVTVLVLLLDHTHRTRPVMAVRVAAV